MSKLRIGMVGLGSMSVRHVEAIRKCSQMELSAICTRSASNLNERANLWGVSKTYLNYEDMLLESDINAVVIITPNKFHAPMTMTALKAGKHVFCEKPPAISAAEVKEIMECANGSGKVLMYGFMFRFSRKYNFIRELREKGMFGEIYFAKAGTIRRSGNPGGWFTNKEMSGGGPLIDIGSHIIDLSLYLMGDYEPVSVFARTFKQTENLDNIKEHGSYKAINVNNYSNDVEEMALVVINFDNGACLVVETSNVSHIKDDTMFLEMLGTKGGITVDPRMEIHTSYQNYLMNIIPQVDCKEFNYQAAIDNEICHFGDCIINNVECIASAKSGLKLMKIIDAAYESADRGKLIEIR